MLHELPPFPPRPLPGTFLSIRTAQLQDLPGIATLLTDSFHSAPWLFWLAPVLRLGIYHDLHSRHLHPLPQHVCLVGLYKTTTTSQESLVGTVEVALRSLSPLHSSACKSPYISNLAVDPVHRREGIAQRLLLACERTVESWGESDLYLHVLESNTAARRLYAKAGYQIQEADSLWISTFLGQPRRLLLHKRLR